MPEAQTVIVGAACLNLYATAGVASGELFTTQKQGNFHNCRSMASHDMHNNSFKADALTRAA